MSRKSRLAAIEERRRTVAANLLGGLTYRQMAEALGVSLGTIANDVKIILGRWRREQLETVDGHVQVELRRIDRALNAIWNGVLEGKMSAIDRFVRLSERRAKLLGMDAPAKVAPTDPTGEREYAGALSDEERAARVVALLERARARRDRQAGDGE